MQSKRETRKGKSCARFHTTNTQHAPTHITLEGETEPGVWNFICREEVVRAGTACWDCVIHI